MICKKARRIINLFNIQEKEKDKLLKEEIEESKLMSDFGLCPNCGKTNIKHKWFFNEYICKDCGFNRDHIEWILLKYEAM